MAGLSIAEFWAATPAELAVVLEADHELRADSHDGKAWMLAHLISALAQTKRRLEPGRLFKALRARRGKALDASEAAERAEAARRRLEAAARGKFDHLPSRRKLREKEARERQKRPAPTEG